MNNGPPPDAKPTDLWLALTAIPRPYRLVDLPRKLPGTDQPVGQIAMWPLSQEEQMVVNAEADRYTKKLLKDPQRAGEANLGYDHTYANEVAVQILWRVCRDASALPESAQRPAFPSPTLVRKQLTADEVGLLFKEYLTVQYELGPIVAYMNEDEMEAWVRRLEAGGSAYPFDSLSWEQQRTLVLFMARQLVRFWTGTSSAGSPPAALPTSGESETHQEADEPPALSDGDDPPTLADEEPITAEHE